MREDVKKDPQAEVVAVMFVRNGAGVDDKLTAALATAMKLNGLNVSSDVLTDLSAADGTFDRLYHADMSEMTRLDLGRFADHLALGRSSVEFKAPVLDGLIVAKATAEIRIVSTKTGEVLDRISISTDGKGFSNEKAEEDARELMIKKVNENSFDSLKKQ